MAFIPEDEQDSQESGMNVLANQSQMQMQQPGQQQPEQQNQQTQQISSGSPTTIGGGQAPIGGGQQAPQSRGTRKKQGSGMFTNVRKYIQANKPAAQRMTQAVTGDVQQETQGIRDQVQKQQQQFQQSLAQNQANLQQSQQFAQEAVQKAGSGQLSEQDFSRFYNLASGRQQIEAPEAMNVMQQDAKARALQGIAKRAGTETGRQDLLRRTFGDNQRYTRGQRALDALILGGDPNRAKTLQEELRSTTGELADEVSQARRNALQQAARAQMDARELPQNLMGMVGEAQTGMQQNIEKSLEQRRQDLVQQQETFKQALASGQVTEEQLKQFVNQEALDRSAQQRRDQLNKAAAEARAQMGPGGRSYGPSPVGSGLELDAFLGGFGQNVQSGGYGQNIMRAFQAVEDRDDSIRKHTNDLARLLDYERGFGAADVYRATKQLRDLGYDNNQIADLINEPLLASGSTRAKQLAQEGFYDIAGREALGRWENKLNLGGYIGPPSKSNILSGGDLRRSMQKQIQDRLAREIEAAAKRVDPNKQMQEFLEAANQQRRRDLDQFVSGYDPQNIRQQDVITEEMVARQQALARLAGQEIENPLQPSGREIAPGEFDLYGALRRLGVYR